MLLDSEKLALVNKFQGVNKDPESGSNSFRNRTLRSGWGYIKAA